MMKNKTILTISRRLKKKKNLSLGYTKFRSCLEIEKSYIKKNYLGRKSMQDTFNKKFDHVNSGWFEIYNNLLIIVNQFNERNWWIWLLINLWLFRNEDFSRKL